jgi:hypothetical protein
MEIEDALKYIKTGLSIEDAMQKAGFVKDNELQSVLDNIIIEEKEKNPYFLTGAPFADIKKDDETIDELLSCEKYDIKTCLIGYYKELRKYEIDTILVKTNFGIKQLFELLDAVCKYISENTDKPLHLQNKIVELLLEFNKYPGFGQLIQILVLQGLIRWFEGCNINEGDKGYTEATELYDFVYYRLTEVLVHYCLVFEKNENSIPLDNYLATNEIYKSIERVTNTNIETKNEPQQFRFTCSFTTNEAKLLYEGLTTNGFLPKGTIYSHFCYVFGCMAIPDNEKPFERLQWIKTNDTTNGIMPNKKSLLDLLTILGIPETEIKQKINQLFIIPKGVKFRSNNYIYSHGKLNTISEYHNELVEIVNQSKKK